MNQTISAQSDHTHLDAAPYRRRLLLADATTCGASALLLTIGGGLLAPVLGLPEALLRYAGVALVPFVVVLLVVARQSSPSGAAVRGIAASNLAWVAASILLLESGWVAPTTLGTAFVLAQAVAVAALAALQWRAAQ